MEDHEFKVRIERQFDRYCMNVIDNAFKEHIWKALRRVENECFLEDLSSSTKEWIQRTYDENNDSSFYRIKDRSFTKEMIFKALEKLPDESSEVLDLYYFRKLNDAQIGKTLNISRRLTTYRRNKALEKMKRYLEEESDEEKRK